MREVSKQESEAREEVWQAIGFIEGALRCLRNADSDRDAIYAEISAKANSIQYSVSSLDAETEEDNFGTKSVHNIDVIA